MLNKKLSAVISAACLMLAAGNQTAHAEAGISVTTDGSTPSAVTSNVKFKVIVPKVMILSVGSFGSTANTVTWNYNFGESSLAALSNADGTSAQWSAASGTAPAAAADADDDATSNGKLDVKVFGNFGNLAITATTVTDFSVVSAGFAKPSLSEISATATNGNISHANLDGFAGGSSTALTATNGVVLETDEWAYTYTPGNTPAGGTYNAEVQYTLASA